MPDRFQQIMKTLERIERKIDTIMESGDMDDFLYGEDDYDEETFEEEISTPDPRNTVKVKGNDGEDEYVNWSEIPDKMKHAIDLSRQQGTPFQVYRDDGGKLRIMVSNEVSAIIHKEETYQQPVPRER